MFKNIWSFVKFLNKDNIKLFFSVFYYKFLLTELKELYFSFKLFFYDFFFKPWTTLRVFTLIFGWFFLIIPFLLFVALFYRIFVVFVLKFLVFLLDYFKVYKEYAIFKYSEQNRSVNLIVLKSLVEELPVINKRKNGKWVKIDPYTFEEKLIAETLSKLSLSKYDMSPSVTGNLLQILYDCHIKLSSDDMWKVFLNLSQNRHNHYIDNFSNMFLLYSVNWENLKYVSYLKRRKKFYKILDGIIPFYFFYFFSSQFWKKVWKWVVIDRIVFFIKELDWTVYKFLKRTELFILYRLPRYYFLLYNRIYVPLNYFRARVEFSIFKRYRYRNVYYTLYKWSIIYFFKYGIKRFVKRFVRLLKFLFLCLKIVLIWLKLKIKILIYYFLCILFFPLNVIFVFCKFFVNIIIWIILQMKYSRNFWKNYFKVILINRFNYVILLPSYYWKILCYFFFFFFKLNLYYLCLINNNIKTCYYFIIYYLKKITYCFKIVKLYVFFYFSYLKIFYNYLKQFYYINIFISRIILLETKYFIKRLIFKLRKNLIKWRFFVKFNFMYLKIKLRFIKLKIKNYFFKIKFFIRRKISEFYIFLDNLEKRLINRERKIAKEIENFKN